MIYTYLYQKDVGQCSWHVAHLYEHAFCHAFFEYLANKGIEPGIFGWVNAETFQYSIFVSFGFYSKEIADMFEEFITIDISELIKTDRLIAEIGAEDRAIYSVIDRNELEKQLSQIAQKPWTRLDNAQTPRELESPKQNDSPLTKTYSVKSYKKVAISYSLKDFDNNDIVLFSRWSIIINDLIFRSIRRQITCSSYESSPIICTDDFVGMTELLYFKKEEPIKKIKELISNAVNSFDVDKNFQYIEDHFREFGTHKPWIDHPIKLFKQTGIIASNKSVCRLATKNNIKKLMEKLVIDVFICSKEYEEDIEKIGKT